MLATARQAVAGMGSLFGTASRKLELIGSSIDKKAMELINTTTSPTGRDEAERTTNQKSNGYSQERGVRKAAPSRSGSRAGSWKQEEREDTGDDLGEWGWGIHDDNVSAEQTRYFAVQAESASIVLLEPCLLVSKADAILHQAPTI